MWSQMHSRHGVKNLGTIHKPRAKLQEQNLTIITPEDGCGREMTKDYLIRAKNKLHFKTEAWESVVCGEVGEEKETNSYVQTRTSELCNLSLC